MYITYTEFSRNATTVQSGRSLYFMLFRILPRMLHRFRHYHLHSIPVGVNLHSEMPPSPQLITSQIRIVALYFMFMTYMCVCILN